MAVDPLQFSIPAAYSGVDWSPLGRLGQVAQKQNQDQLLANLGQQYQATTPPTPSTFTPSPGGFTPSPGGTNAQFSAPPTTGDVNAAIKATAAAAGMDVPTWKAIASIESSLNPASNFDRSTQYKGLFQIGSRGEGSEWSRHGKGSIYNAMDNATAAAALANENNTRFKNTFGRDPTAIETYMMHQQGFGFYKNGTMTNIEGNPYPGMSGPQTPQSFEQGWGKEIERRAKYFRKSEDAKNGDQSD